MVACGGDAGSSILLWQSCRKCDDGIIMLQKPAFSFQGQGKHPDEGAILNW